MKIVVADTGVIISLGIVEKIEIIEKVFGWFFIAISVYKKIEKHENPEFPQKHVISSKNTKKELNRKIT